MAVLEVAAAKTSTVREGEETNEEVIIVASQECLLSKRDKGSEGLEKFLRDQLDSLSGKGLERILRVAPIVVLELLDESLVERGSAGSDVVPIDKEMPRSRVDHILRSKVKEKKIGSVSKRRLCDVDADVADGRTSRSVAFQLEDERGELFSAVCELVVVSDAGQSFSMSSRPDGT